MQANGVYLLNPLLCMNKKYFENVLKNLITKQKFSLLNNMEFQQKFYSFFHLPLMHQVSLKNTTLNISNLISTSKFILLIV